LSLLQTDLFIVGIVIANEDLKDLTGDKENKAPQTLAGFLSILLMIYIWGRFFGKIILC
jgi:F420-0:gamma-glutamyl ligase-like protein